ncbi:prealbumin-like fold domain-containing protein, partial [Mesorhizobium japonicum]|uniref:prealbumin-like fold domain-containing protein n=1 Tax=Mesorhizobium japonicum TaxID=2066070 RepID=UPI003B59D0DD
VLTASDGSTLTLPNSFTFADFAISSPTPNQYVTRFPTITGIGLPGTSVAVSVASVGTLCSTTVDSGGAWSCASTLQLPQHGTFTLNAAQTGIGNPASASVSVVVSVDWTVSTSATVAGAAVANGALVAPGSTITYQVDYVSSAAIAMAGVTSADDLTGVLDDATFVANSAQLVVNGAAAVPVSDPSASVLTVPAFSLPAGKSAVLTYQVTVNANRWGAVLSRTVTATSTTEPPLSCGAACSTSEQTAVPLQVQKVGEDSSANVVPMTGSQWAVYSSANATTPVVGPIPAGSDVGLFRSTALPAGTYWLEESTSLSGFSLLAQRVQFTLNPDLSITLVSSPSNVTVTTVNGSATIRVMDVPRMALPQAGGPGTLIFYLAGFALLAVAVVAVVVAALVRRLRSSERIRKVIS